MTHEADITIVGAGVVGLAIAARASSTAGREIIVLDHHDGFGRETSSRNSEVIHAGIYYKPGSLKARLCVEGRDALYKTCATHNIGHKRLTKLLTAGSPREVVILERLIENGARNGAGELRMISQREALALEPNIQCKAALFSPLTGIIDSHGLMSLFERQARSRGAILSYRSNVVGIEPLSGQGDGFRVAIEENADGGEKSSFTTRVLINAAGLGCEQVARLAGVDVEKADYHLYPCKGEYFSIAPGVWKRHGVERLVYPPPGATGLGIHLALDLAGRARLGPNSFYVDRVDYDVDPDHAAEFLDSARCFLPFLRLEHLSPDTAGMRPKLQGPGVATPRDFIIRHEADLGLPGLIDLIGIDSPGLTSSPAIARVVDEMIGEILA